VSSEINELVEALLDFRKKRDWKQFHTPKNLAISISLEAAELLEHFQWAIGEEELSTEKRLEIAKELADLLIYVLLMSNDLGIDLVQTTKAKIMENSRKYPVDKAKRSAKKYTEL
jgi:dCTP diphosphatase